MRFSEIIDRRLLLISGKGGVGRTVISAALAIAAAKAGKRVLVGEIGDPAGGESPLAHLFGRPRLTTHALPLPEGVRGCHLWAQYGHELFLRDALPGGALIAAASRSATLQTFLSAAPSFLEMGWFYHLLHLLKAERDEGGFEHELIIMDMPATGHTLALTGLPEILLRLIRTGPIYEGLLEGQALLQDPAVTGAWVVTLPETLPIGEAVDLLAGLEQGKVPIGGVVLNRYPHDPFTAEERATLEIVLDGQAVLGALDFHRIAASRLASFQLHEQVGVPVVTVPERVEAGEALPRAIAEILIQRDGAP